MKNLNIEDLYYNRSLKNSMFSEYIEEFIKCFPGKGLGGYNSTVEVKHEVITNIAFSALDCGFFMGYETAMALEELDKKFKAIVEDQQKTLTNWLKSEKVILKEVK